MINGGRSKLSGCLPDKSESILEKRENIGACFGPLKVPWICLKNPTIDCQLLDVADPVRRHFQYDLGTSVSVF